MKIVLGAALAALLAGSAFAQASSTFSDVPDRFQIDTGFYRVNPNTMLTFDPVAGGSNNIDFEKDLGLNQTADSAWIEGDWRVGRRHQLKLGYTWQNRTGDNVVLDRDINWGGVVYKAGLTAGSENGAKLLGGYYRFAAFRNDRFEIGPTLGIGYVWLDARVQATGTISTPIGNVTTTLDQSASTGSITGAVGGYTNGWVLPRLNAHADCLYFKLSTNGDSATVTDWRLGAFYYISRNIGLGLQYKYNKLSYDRALLSRKLGGEVTYKGPQILASLRF